LPPDTRLGDNANAFKGGFRLWEDPTIRHRGQVAHDEPPRESKSAS
jgi:hypothetical protein